MKNYNMTIERHSTDDPDHFLYHATATVNGRFAHAETMIPNDQHKRWLADGTLTDCLEVSFNRSFDNLALRDSKERNGKNSDR